MPITTKCKWEVDQGAEVLNKLPRERDEFEVPDNFEIFIGNWRIIYQIEILIRKIIDNFVLILVLCQYVRVRPITLYLPMIKQQIIGEQDQRACGDSEDYENRLFLVADSWPSGQEVLCFVFRETEFLVIYSEYWALKLFRQNVWRCIQT